MRVREYSVVIDAEPDRVWRTYVDPRRIPEWQTGKPVIVDIRGDGAQAGATYVSRRGRLAARTRVLAAQPPRSLVTGTEAYLGLRLRVSSTLSALPGATRLDLRVQTRWPPGLRLLGRLVERAILDPREGARELRNLKALVEREAGSRSPGRASRGEPVNATIATVTVLVGSAIFLVGAGIGVPRVFTEPDRATKVRMLEEQLVRWRVAQPLYAIGPLVAGTGVGLLAAEVGPGSPRIWIALSCLLLLAGALLWSWSVYQRGRRVREFALGELPGWPFASYVWSTLAGLALLGIGLLDAGFPAWTGWLTLVGALAFVVMYVRLRDIPPFLFYLLLPAVSLGWR